MSANPVLEPALTRPDLLAKPTLAALTELERAQGAEAAARVLTAAIDPGLADTAAFCEAYGVGLEESANCVVLAGKRGGETTFAACLVLATTRADVNGLARRHLGVRKISFAPMDEAVGLTGMEYGGITPLGLPEAWPVLIDRAVAGAPRVVVGSGIRGSKLWLPGALLATLPGAEVLDDLGRPIDPTPDQPQPQQ
jgi:prolyl-tRNA editing enzyme YbaK/EbsC (Cys-tRNA(Pro) deacylase)